MLRRVNSGLVHITAWIAMTLGCVSGGSSAQMGAAGAAPGAAPVAESVVPLVQVAEVVQADGGGHPSVTIHIEVAGVKNDVVLSSDFDSCENVEASVDAIEAIGDDRLRMAQLFCDSGEDYLTRQMVTALLFAGPSPRLLWQGKGSYSNSMDQCIETDVLHFRPGPKGAVEVVRTTEVIAEEDVDPELSCEAQAEAQTVVTIVDIPPRS